ncbi:MAG: glycosyltransferase [Patescibacteria group bacterium]|nr:glycosyltransferase [Patescibacteria group bacterium]
MEEKPLVSVVLPVQNSEKYLSACLDSLLKQNYHNIEIIAIDDNSKDNSFKILKEYKKLDNRIKVFRNVKKYGFPVCFNRAFKKVKGQFIAFMGTNDINAVSRIKKQVNFLLSNPKTVAVGTQSVITDKNNRKKGLLNYPVENAVICQSLIRGFSLNFESVMINRHLIPKDLLKFDKTPYPLFFTGFFLQIASYGELSNLPDYLYYKRKTEDQLALATVGIISSIKLFLKSIFVYDTPRASVFSLLKPAAK